MLRLPELLEQPIWKNNGIFHQSRVQDFVPVTVNALGRHPGGIGDLKLLEGLGEQPAEPEISRLVHSRNSLFSSSTLGSDGMTCSIQASTSSRDWTQGLEMPGGVIENPKVGRGNPAEGAFLLFGLQAASALLPECDIQLRRGHRQADMACAAHTNATDISGKTDILTDIGKMMVGMTRHINERGTAALDFEHFVILVDDQHVFGDGQEIAPQCLHRITVDAPGAGKQLLRIDQMRRTDWMDMDAGALPRPPAGRTAVIQVDVGQQYVCDLGWLQTQGGYSGKQGRGSTSQVRILPAPRHADGGSNRPRSFPERREIEIECMDR